MEIDKPSVERYLAVIREIAASACLTDSHVHPFEVMFDTGSYEPDPEVAGLYRIGKASYAPPTSTSVSLDAIPTPPSTLPPDLVERVLLLSMRRLYTHTGPRCWSDHGGVAGIRRFVLLPVAQPGQTAEARMAEMGTMFRNDPRFLLGYSLSNTLEPEAVETDVLRAVDAHNVRVLKVHPTLSGHEITGQVGKARVNALLRAAYRSGLPVILHGGLSPNIRYSDAACQQGALENLADLDLSSTDSPIIIAHAGAFAIKAEEFKNRVLPLLLRLMARFNHLLVDTSALPADILQLLLDKVDSGRILFGSDAFYEASWKAAVKLYWVLERQFSNPAVLFKQIAGENASKVFGGEG